MEKDHERKYFIPVNGKLYQTSEKVYKTYYKMDRRERYLEEVSFKKNLSLESLRYADYPVEERLFSRVRGVDDEVIEAMMIELMLSKLSILTDYEIWLIKELYLHEKSERQIERESEIPRKTLSYQKKKLLEKLRSALGN